MTGRVPDDPSVTGEERADADSGRWLERFNAVVTDPDRSFEERLDGLFGVGCERLGLEVGALARVDPAADRLEVEYAGGDGGHLEPGTELRPPEPDRLAVTERERPAATADPVGAVDGAGPTAGERTFETCLGTRVPVEDDHDRQLLFLSTEPRSEPLPDGAQALVDLMGQWVRRGLERGTREADERRFEAIFDRTYGFTGLLEPDGTILEANRTALEFGDLDRDEVVGKRLWEAGWFTGLPETRKRAKRAVRRAADGEFVRRGLTVRGADREAVIDFSIKPVTDDDGEVELLIPEGRDVTERKRSQHRLEAVNVASRRLWDADTADEVGEITVEVAGEVLDEPLVTMWSYDGDELVPLAAADADADGNRDPGTGTFDAIPPGTAEMRVFRGGETTLVEDYRALDSPAHPDAPVRTVVLAPLGDHGQLHVGSRSVGSFDDEVRKTIDLLAKNAEGALARLARERELERSRDRLARTERLADVGGWELDLRADELTFTEGTRRIHGVDDDFDPTLEGAVDFYHPDDRETMREAVERCAATGDPYHEEVRLVTAEGHERWVETAGKATRENGEVVRLEGAIRDVTDRKEREQQLAVLYRIMRHNLRNDLIPIQGFSNAIDRELDRREVPPAIAGREVEAFERIADEVSDPPADLQDDVEALRRTVEALSETSAADIHEYRNRIETAVERLVSIGDRVSRLHGLIMSEGRGERRCRLDETVEAVATDLRREYPNAVIDTGRVGAVAVDGPAETLSLAVRELLDNAVRHADDESPAVEVRTVRDGADHVTVEVADRGPGIPDIEVETLRRGEEGALVHGSGLGLWLVNWLATRLNGHLAFEDNEPRGTVVSLTLPVTGGDGGPGGEDDDD